ncbi:MAG: hypothetical protein PHV61_10200 [Limnochordia bacterium]|jgi:hypothetical protein|nr:hypothetical protein [Limnochordia bacterium]
MSTPELWEAKRKVLKHPAVEYIPLYPYPIAKGRLQEHQDMVRLTVLTNPREYEQLQNELQLKKHFVDFGESLVIAVKNAEVLEIKYRGFIVWTFARLEPASYHIFSVTRRYFYKNQLHWQLYDLAGELQSWYNLTL